MDMRQEQLSPIPPLTSITKALIIACVVIYLTDFVLFNLGFQIYGLRLVDIFGLVPEFVHDRHWYWQFFTYIFMHGHPLHLLLNMLILWYFGAEIEMAMGEKGFLFFFLLCGVGAGLFNYGVNVYLLGGSKLTNPIIGASGAIYGVLAAYGLFFGSRYFLVFFVFPMQAKYYVLILGIMELLMGVGPSTKDNVAHFCHVGGFVVGAAYVYFKYILPPRSGRKSNKKDIEKERLKRQFTLIVNPSEKDSEKGPYWN